MVVNISLENISWPQEKSSHVNTSFHYTQYGILIELLLIMILRGLCLLILCEIIINWNIWCESFGFFYWVAVKVLELQLNIGTSRRFTDLTGLKKCMTNESTDISQLLNHWVRCRFRQPVLHLFHSHSTDSVFRIPYGIKPHKGNRQKIISLYDMIWSLCC